MPQILLHIHRESQLGAISPCTRAARCAGGQGTRTYGLRVVANV